MIEVDCSHKQRPHYARGRCYPCYMAILRAGRLDQFPRKAPLKQPDFKHVLTPKQAEVVRDIEAGVLRSYDDASKIGMKPRSVEKLLYRAKRPYLARLLRGGTA